MLLQLLYDIRNMYLQLTRRTHRENQLLALYKQSNPDAPGIWVYLIGHWIFACHLNELCELVANLLNYMKWLCLHYLVTWSWYQHRMQQHETKGDRLRDELRAVAGGLIIRSWPLRKPTVIHQKFARSSFRHHKVPNTMRCLVIDWDRLIFKLQTGLILERCSHYWTCTSRKIWFWLEWITVLLYFCLSYVANQFQFNCSLLWWGCTRERPQDFSEVLSREVRLKEPKSDDPWWSDIKLHRHRLSEANQMLGSPDVKSHVTFREKTDCCGLKISDGLDASWICVTPFAWMCPTFCCGGACNFAQRLLPSLPRSDMICSSWHNQPREQRKTFPQ